MIKSFHVRLALTVALTFGVSLADASVNDTLTFTNTTDERLNIELSITEDSGQRIYDLFVLPNRTSIADFWADSFDATYVACGYGDVTGDSYGCIQGSISDASNNVYFNNNQQPLASTPSRLEADWFLFSAPAASSLNAEDDEGNDQPVEDDDGSTFFIRANCFIGTMAGAGFQRTSKKIRQSHLVDFNAMTQLFDF